MDERQQNSRQLPRLSLKGLFALVAAVAIVLAPYYWFGGFYLYSAGCSFLFIYLYTWRYREGRVGVFTSIAIAAIAILLAEMGIATIVFFVQAMLTAAVCIPLASRKVRPHTFAIVLVALMAAIYGVAFANGAAAMRKMRVLRAQYPFTSLETRLAFERAKQSESAPSINPATFSSAVAKHLNEQDDAQEFRYYTRARALRVLHESSYQEFALAAGYGSARMPFVSMGSVNLNPAAEFKLPTPLAIHHMEAPAQELFDAHNTAVDDFISPQRLGYIKSRREVVGFESHRFTSLNEKWQHDHRNARYWQVVRLELVGLLRYQTPCVYIAKTIPPMEKVADTPHRELNDFEKSGLPQLVTQEDIIVDQRPDRIQMLGALRAGATCLECHHGERGKLLGAFSYELVPMKAAESSATFAGSAK